MLYKNIKKYIRKNKYAILIFFTRNISNRYPFCKYSTRVIVSSTRYSTFSNQVNIGRSKILVHRDHAYYLQHERASECVYRGEHFHDHGFLGKHSLLSNYNTRIVLQRDSRAGLTILEGV